jgi:hypothetical protein
MVLPYDYKLFSAATILDVFETVNSIYVEKKKEPVFNITLIQSQEQINRHGRLFHGYTVKSLQSHMKADTVLIPAFTTSNMYKTLEKNKMYLPWLRKQFKAGCRNCQCLYRRIFVCSFWFIEWETCNHTYGCLSRFYR